MIPENFLVRNDGSTNFLKYLEWLNIEKKSKYWTKSITDEYVGHYYGHINGATLCLKRTDNIAVDIYTKGKHVLWFDDVNYFLEVISCAEELSIGNEETKKFLDDLNLLSKEEIIEVVSKFFKQTDIQATSSQNASDNTYMLNEFGRVQRTLLNRLKNMVSHRVSLKDNSLSNNK